MTFDPVADRRASIRQLRPYYQAPTEPLLRLDQNTNLTGPNPAVARLDATQQDLTLYPTRDADPLLEAIERHHRLQEGSVICTNGSDEALDLILKAYTEPGDTLQVPDPSYSLYPFYAALHGLTFKQQPLDDDWLPHLDTLIAEKAKVTLIASPNNPTGRAMDPKQLERLVQSAAGLVVIDEAYAEYHDSDGLLALTETARNLVVIRTFSKAYALAGTRLGWLAAHPDTMQALRLVKPPFNVGLLTQELGILALKETSFVEESVRTVRAQRKQLGQTLTGLGFTVVPSDANFLLCFPPDNAPEGPLINERLRERGIAARVFPKHPRLKRAIRFTVGNEEHTQRLTRALETVLAEAEEAS